MKVVFKLKKHLPAEIDAEVKSMLGPAGSTVVLTQSQQLVVSDQAGRLRTVRDFINRIDGAELGLQRFELKNARAEEVLPVLHQLLEIPDEAEESIDKSIRVVQLAGTNTILVSGRADKVNRAIDIINNLDRGDNPDYAGPRQLDIIPLNGLDADTVLKVLQTVIAGEPDIHLSTDPRGNLIVLARVKQIATIKNVVKQMTNDSAQNPEVIKLLHNDPQTAADAINRTFNNADAKNPTAPQVQVDSANRQLIIKATAGQFVQIKELLTKMGERFDGDNTPGPSERTFNLGPGDTAKVIALIKGEWPNMHGRIRSSSSALHLRRPTRRATRRSRKRRSAGCEKGRRQGRHASGHDQRAASGQAFRCKVIRVADRAVAKPVEDDDFADPRPAKPAEGKAPAPAGGNGGIVVPVKPAEGSASPPAGQRGQRCPACQAIGGSASDLCDRYSLWHYHPVRRFESPRHVGEAGGDGDRPWQQ